MFEIDCPKCGTRMSAELDTYACPKCKHEVFMGRVLMDRLQAGLKDLKQAFGSLSLDELKRRAWDESDPFTAAVIAILAFFVAKSIAIPVLIAVIHTMALLLGPFGLVLAIVVPIIALKHQARIKQKAAEMKATPGPVSPKSGAKTPKRKAARRKGPAPKS